MDARTRDDVAAGLAEQWRAMAPFAVLTLDCAGDIVLWEGRDPAALGIRGDQVVGRSFREVFGDQPVFVSQLERALKGEAVTTDAHIGGVEWIVRFAPVMSGREISGALCIAVDRASENTRSTEHARQALRFLDSVIENIPDMIFVKDARDLRFVRFNRAGEELLGHSRTALIGKSDHDFFPPEQAEFFQSRDRAVLEAGHMIDTPEETIETRHKGTRILHTKKIPIADDRGRPLYLLGISADITDRKQIEVERQHVVEALRRLDAMKTQLIANVSHEFRTPLALIMAFADRVARNDALSPTDRSDVASIHRNANVLLGLVNDLLDVARVEAQRMDLEYTDGDASQFLRAVAADFDALAREHSVTLTLDAPSPLPAQFDREKMRRVLSNLFSNALKHTPANGVIRASASAVGDQIRWTVADNGPGVPEAIRERIFERFFQAEQEGALGHGTGLGLAIVRDFTGLHGGRAWVEPVETGGARFVVEVPAHAPAGVAIGARTQRDSTVIETTPAPRVNATPVQTTHIASDPNRPTVLVVEDNDEMRALLVSSLEADYAVLTAGDGREGLQLALDAKPDLIVTDVMMPHMSGDTLVREVRRASDLAAVPILVLTARADEAMRVSMLRNGAQDFLTKPFSMEELRARVANLVTMKRTRDVLESELELRSGDVESLARQLASKRRALMTALDATSLAREHAEQANRFKSELLALVSHELRTPVTSLQLRLDAVQRMRETPLAPEVDEHIKRMASAAQRLYQLTDSLLERARIESGHLEVRAEPCDLVAIARDVIDELGEQAHHKGIELRLAEAPSTDVLASDPRLVRLVLINLVANAIKFTAKGFVTVSVASDGIEHRIEVRDTGPGIPEDQQRRIFEPFVQLGAIEHKHLPGIGLGLAIVRDTVGALRGRLSLHSDGRTGTTFVVTLASLSASIGTASAVQH